MKKENFLTGRKGEEIASKFLEEKGFLIKERNFRTRFGEIDIVCYDGDILVFVEVKTKIGHDFGEPEEMVNPGKLAKVQRMGEIYCLLKFPKTKSVNSSQSNFSTHLHDSLRQNLTASALPDETAARDLDLSASAFANGTAGEWKGRCRVDVMGIVLQENGEVERIRHYEAVY